MKRMRWQKKGYKGLRVDTVLRGLLGFVAVLETNLISGTLNTPKLGLVLLGVFAVVVFNTSIVARGYKINSEVKSGKRTVFSANAFKALKIVTTYGAVPMIPLLVMIFSDTNNKKLYWWLMSAVFLIVIKCYFDDIITFTEKGFSSGFDEIELDSDYKIELRQIGNMFRVGELYYIELYKKNMFWGWDRLVQEDAMHIVNVLQQKNNNDTMEQLENII